MFSQTMFRGVLFTREGYPCRLTDGARSFYHGLSPAFADRADCTAGVALRFVTDAGTLYAKFAVQSFCRSQNVVDVYENGVQIGSVRLPDMQYTAEMRFVRKSARRALIELWLPNTCGLELLDCDFGQYETVDLPRRRLLILGDSIWQGIQSYHPTNAIANQVTLALDADAVNQSVGGAQFFPETLEKLPWEPDRLLVALGINDAFDPTEAWREKLPAYFRKLRALYPETPAAALTPIWNVRMETDDGLYDRTCEIADAIRREAGANHVRVIEGMGMVPHSARFFNEDGVHPNDTGFLRYAVKLTPLLNWKQWG